MSYKPNLDVEAMDKGIDYEKCVGEDDESVIEWALNNRKEFDEFVIVGSFAGGDFWDEVGESSRNKANFTFAIT